MPLSLFSFGHLLLDMGPTSKSGLLFLSELFLNKKNICGWINGINFLG